MSFALDAAAMACMSSVPAEIIGHGVDFNIDNMPKFTTDVLRTFTALKNLGFDRLNLARATSTTSKVL